jgi:hypothetical protein
MLLTWPHLPDASYRKARVLANDVCVGEDVPWGAFEDQGNADDMTVVYRVEYQGVNGGTLTAVNDNEIRKVPRLPSICAVTIDITDDRGFPDANRHVTVADFHEPRVPQITRKYVANMQGRVLFFARRNSRIHVHLENAAAGLDCIVPDLSVATYADLMAQGSMAVHDRRGWY